MNLYQDKQKVFIQGSQSKIIHFLNNNQTINFINLVDAKNNTPLHYAACKGYIKGVKEYLKLIQKQQLWEKLKNKQVSKQVIKYSIKVWINAENNQGLTALHYASLNGFIEIIRILQEAGSRLDKTTNTGLNALMLAAQSGKLQSMLYFRGKLDVNSRDDQGCTALHWACHRGHEHIVRYLVSQNYVHLNFQNLQGRTPLHLATLQQHTQIIQILLKNGAKRLIRDKSSKLAFDYATQNNFQKIQRLLDQKQKCGFKPICKPKFKFSPSKKVSCGRIILLFLIFLCIISCNYLVNCFPFKQNQEICTKISFSQLITQKFIYSLTYSCISLLTSFILLAISLKIYFKKQKNQNYNLSYLLRNINLTEEYCFECQVLRQQTTYHCDFCHQCIEGHYNHSKVLGTCIGSQKKIYYIFFLITLELLLALEVLNGAGMAFQFFQQIQNISWQQAPKMVMIGIDIICFLAFVIVMCRKIRILRYICKINLTKRIKNITLTTLDSNKTQLVQRRKSIEEQSREIKKKVQQGDPKSHISNINSSNNSKISASLLMSQNINPK